MLFYKHFRRDPSAMEKLTMLVQRKIVGASMLRCRANDQGAGCIALPGEQGLAASPPAHKNNQNG